MPRDQERTRAPGSGVPGERHRSELMTIGLDETKTLFRRRPLVLDAPLREVDPAWVWPSLPQLEGAVWRTLSVRPAHLLPRAYAGWDELILEAARHGGDAAHSAKVVWRMPLSRAVFSISAL